MSDNDNYITMATWLPVIEENISCLRHFYFTKMLKCERKMSIGINNIQHVPLLSLYSYLHNWNNSNFPCPKQNSSLTNTSNLLLFLFAPDCLWGTIFTQLLRQNKQTKILKWEWAIFDFTSYNSQFELNNESGQIIRYVLLATHFHCCPIFSDIISFQEGFLMALVSTPELYFSILNIIMSLQSSQFSNDLPHTLNRSVSLYLDLQCSILSRPVSLPFSLPVPIELHWSSCSFSNMTG